MCLKVPAESRMNVANTHNKPSHALVSMLYVVPTTYAALSAVASFTTESESK